MAGPLRRITDYDGDRPRPRKRRGLIRKPRYWFLRKEQLPEPGQGGAHPADIAAPPIGQAAPKKARQLRRWGRQAGRGEAG
ncbi:MAG: hypothetical protein ABIJ48_10100 [Actinomycetota bacterium]